MIATPIRAVVVAVAMLAADAAYCVDAGAVHSADPVPTPAAAAVNAQRLAGANTDAAQWLSVGRTYDEQRFSPLKQINTTNVTKLGLAWFADFDTNRGQEATPLAIDGVLYVSTAWSKVKAYDARTGKLLWAYDPKVPGEFAGRGCCDVVNRGLAAWNGKIYVASYDGRLIALDARTGVVAWEVLTLDHDKPVTITGAPRVIKGKVLIGNSGGEFGVRGYLSAYDAESGKLLWRFFTVPGNPADGFETPVLRTAAQTWNGKWWEIGGGGTVWDGMAYDARLWSMEAQTGVVAAPASFELDGEQYIAEEVGYGLAPYGTPNQSRLLVLKLGGTAALPPATPPLPKPVLNPPPSTASAQTIDMGHEQFTSHCATCHEPPAANRSVFPDLRYSAALNSEAAFNAIVLEGALQPAGMASFKGRMSPEEVQSVRAYLIERANQAKNSFAAAR